MFKRSNLLFVCCVTLIALFCFVGLADAAGGCKDRDNDGYFNKAGCGSEVDCDDNDAAVNPGAVEECTDGIDNDCDGLVDIQDPDAVNCPVCTDNDGDGYNIEGGGCGAVDCNDADPAINPGAAEGPDGDPTCSDTVDNDCDGLIDTAQDPGCAPLDCSAIMDRTTCNDDPNCMWEGGKNNGQCVPTPTCTDNDGDGYGEGAACLGLDCDDTNPAINPGAAEGPDGDPTCSDTIDNDCDGLIDTAQDPGCAPFDCSQFTKRKDCTANSECIWEGGMCVSVPTCTDNDGDGYGVGAACLGPDCNDADPDINPGASDANCNGIDENCDTIPDDGYVITATSCGVGECSASGQLECQGGTEVDTCSPGTPAADDSVCNGLDDDCNGTVDEDYVITSTSCGVGECSANGQLECQSGAEVDTCSPGTPGVEGPEGDPTCGDTLDNDCDGTTDLSDSDCACVPTGSPDDNCDGIDDDCNGTADDAYVAPPTTCGVGECSGNTGLLECQSGSTVDTCDPLAGAAADDSLCNGLDDDCDGPVDEDYSVTPTTCGVGECSGNTGQIECQAGSEVDTCDPLAGAAADDSLCNGLDDDCDGPVDEDYTATPTTCGVGECSGNTGLLECQAGSTVDTCDPLAGAAADDSLCNGLDDDCDGPVDEDYTITPTTCGVGECAGNAGQLECQAGSEVDTCDPLAGAGVEGPEGNPTCSDTLDNDCDGDTDIADQDCACVPTGSPDNNCDGIDDDCNGTADDAYVAPPTTCGVGECSGNTGLLECQAGSTVDTCDPLAGAAADDSLCNGLDDDCDGPVDEDYTATPTTCGVGECSGNTGLLECQAGSTVDTCDPLAGAAADDSLCNGLDDDCDGPVDEDYTATPTTCGVGECSGNTGLLECQAGSTVDTCDPLAGAAADDSLCNGLDDDCDGPVDEDYTITPTTCGVGECAGNAGQLECQAGSEVDTCDPLAGAGVEGPEGNPTCSDTLDNDCDGDTDIADQDCACVPTGSPDNNCDGIDDDCNGTADDAYVAPPTTCGVGECSGNTGLLECQAGSTVDTCDPLAGAAADDSLCNGLDDDCDGPVDEDYTATPTTCGVGECSGNTGLLECQAGSTVDTCDPLAGAAADDSLCNGLDDDCDGPVDEDYTATPTTCGVGECSGNTGLLECQAGSTVDTCDPLAGAAADDSVCNGLDDDCNGQVDEDYTATPTTCGVGECSGNTGLLECQAGSTVDTCDPLAGAAPNDALCNGLDDDCDGPIDEDFVISPTTCGVGECLGNTGQIECQGGSVVDTCDPLAGAAADDSVCNGLDDDCDGPIDEDYVTSTTNCSTGVCSSTGLLECQSGSEVDTCSPGSPTEDPEATCNDGLDNDCDGLTDTLEDPDCAIAPPPPHDTNECDYCHVSPTDFTTPIPDGQCEQCHTPGGALKGSFPTAPDVLAHSDVNGSGSYAYSNNCIDCHNPMFAQANLRFIRSTISGSVVPATITFTAFSGAGSFADGPPHSENICETCHSLTSVHRYDGSTPPHNDGADCTACHAHDNAFIPAGGSGCTDCHNGIPAGGAGYVTRDVVGVDYTQPSRHVFGGTVTSWDCIVCHREGDANQAASGTIANTALHQNAQVEMRNVDSINSGGVWDKNNTSDAMYTELDNFCMGCHDPDGASGINVKATDDGVNLNNSRALTPFNSSDGLSSTGTQGGTVWQAAYERTRVLDVFSKFDPTNPSHHAVRGPAYNSHNANWGAGAWVDVLLKSGNNLVSSGLYESATLHCTDCHVENSHGGPNGFRLQASSIDGTCYLCHNSNVYGNSSSSLTRWDHSQDSAVWGSAEWAIIGQYDGNPGSACMNCHGGDPATDGFGGIHGLQSGADSRSGEERYRFQGGSYMSHQPGSWTTTGGSATCYFAGGSSQDWSNCSRHSGTEAGRTSPAQYDRGVPGDY